MQIHPMISERKESEWKPGVGYFRRAIYNAETIEDVRKIALVLCLEIEKEHEWAAGLGIKLPRWYATQAEAHEKNFEIGA